ncbi:hypothetical protein PILCRDRAFT_31921, partial [Piloderma croceum F 1598]
SIYVMLSRVKSLEGLVVLKWFPSNILEQLLQEEFCVEFLKLEALDIATHEW